MLLLLHTLMSPVCDAVDLCKYRSVVFISDVGLGVGNGTTDPTILTPKIHHSIGINGIQ